MPAVLRVATTDDWAAFRAVRLRALADAPTAFGALLADAVQQPEETWRSRVAGPGPTLLGWDGDEPVAMGGLWVPDDSAEAYVWGMWVAPTARGRGLGSRMLTDLVDRARGLGRAVVLHVTDGNDGARRLYEAHGFMATGEWQPLREGSELRVEALRLA